MRSGNFYGRNYDWTYDNAAHFVIRTAASQGGYSSVGVAGSIPSLTNDLVESRRLAQAYRILPFMTIDGINEKGVCCNVNVVPTEDMGITTGTNPDGKELCVIALPRYILDYCDSADDAIEKILGLNIYAPRSDRFSQELQLMIADSTKTYVVEFINNTVEVFDVTNTKPYITNFYIKGAEFNQDGTVDVSSLTTYAMGIERYNIITDGINDADDLDGMTILMTSLNYSQTYSLDVSPLWVSEYVGGNRKITDPYESFVPLVERYHEYWENRSRDDGKMWHTVHTSVYDLQNKKLYLLSQEENSSNQKKHNLNHYYTSEEIDAMLNA